MACEAGTKYRASLPQRFRDEAQNLVNLTGWPLANVLAEMEATGQPKQVRGGPSALVGGAIRAFTPVLDGLWALALPFHRSRTIVRRAHASQIQADRARPRGH